MNILIIFTAILFLSVTNLSAQVEMVDDIKDGKNIINGPTKTSARINNNFPSQTLKYGTVSYSPTGSFSYYDLQDHGSPQMIWQDPNNPNNVHCVYLVSPDSSINTFYTAYSFSSDGGANWTFVTNVLDNSRGTWPAISGFDNGNAVITCRSNANNTSLGIKLFADTGPGLGQFYGLYPNDLSFTWPKLIAYGNDKVVLVSSQNGPAASTNSLTDINPPGIFSGFVFYNGEHGSRYFLGKSKSGKIGHVYINYPWTDHKIVYRSSDDFGNSWSVPTTIWSRDKTLEGLKRGVSIIFVDETPVVAFESASIRLPFYEDYLKPSQIKVWNPEINNGIPVVAVDSSDVPFFPNTGEDGFLTLSRPVIGKSSDEKILIMTFVATTGNRASTADSSVYYSAWIAVSTDRGATWINHEKITPDKPLRDWRHISISPTNNRIGNQLVVQMVCQSDSVPGTHASYYSPPIGLSEQVGIRYTTFVKVGINSNLNEVPAEFNLHQNYPNPFNPVTKIKYDIPFDGNVSIKIFDISGRLVMTAVNELKKAGRYEFNFSGANLSSGVYYYRITSGTFSQVRKMILLK